jgi:integrase
VQAKATPGIRVRHSRSCPSLTGGECTARRAAGCAPYFEAFVFDKRTGSKIRKTFPTLAAAKGWRTDALSMQRRGQLQKETRRTVREVGDEWLEKANADPPEILSRSGVPFKPSVLRSYATSLRLYIYPDLGSARLADLRRGDVQALVDRLVGKGLSGSTVRNAVMPLRVLVRYAIRREGLIANPTLDLDLPAPGGRRERAATPTEAAELVAALEEGDQALWATAFYAGLRRGELRALRVSNLAGLDGEGVASLSVEHAWDDQAGEIAPKSKAAVREIPIPETLRLILVGHLERTGRGGDDLVFGRTEGAAFTPSFMRDRAAAAWKKANAKRAEKKLAPLQPIGLHECRHSYSSFLDAAGISEARADRYMGHANPSVASRYRHQLAGQLEDDAETIEAYLAGTAAGKVVAIAAARTA